MESGETIVSEARRGWSALGAFASRPLGHSVLDHLVSDLIGSLWTNLFWYFEAVANLLWSLLVVRLSRSYHKERRRCHYLQNRPFRPPMTVHFLTPGPLSALGMPSYTAMICKVRHVAVKLKIFGLNGVQACAFVIWLPFSPILTIFRHVSTKFFSPGPNSCLAMPSNWTWV